MLTPLLVVCALLPLAVLLFLSWVWWASLTRPWVFVFVAIVGLYVLMVSFVTLAFRGIGIASAAPGPQPLLGPIELRLLLFILAFLVLGTLALWGLKLFFSRT